MGEDNILIAVAGAKGDGTSGLRQASDATLRQEIEKFSHIIFSSNPSQREFWLGQKSLATSAIREQYNGLKPCLHGSDAHKQDELDENRSPSFLARARELIGGATTTLTWGGDEDVTRSLNGSDANSHMSFPRARYLSQQFVEELCSAKGVSDGLVEEIERVIFEAHPQDDRDGAIDFTELRDQKTSRFQQARKREDEAISNISEAISTEFEKENLILCLTTQVAQKTKQIVDYNTDLANLVVKGTEAQAARHTQLSEAAQKLQSSIQNFGRQKRVFSALQDKVRSMRATGTLEILRQVQARHHNSGLSEKQ